MSDSWINYTPGVPIVADFLSLRGLGKPFCLNLATGQIYYLAAGDVVTAATAAAAVPDPIVPADGTQNITGALAVSGNITGLNLSGTNTGDQTSIVGISSTMVQFDAACSDGNFVYAARLISTTAPIAGGGDLSADRTLSLSGTKAQFDTACSDGNFLYVGDITQYTDEMAQDAVGAMVDASLTYVDATPLLQRAALTGHITAAAGSNATLLGSFTLAQLDAAVSDANVVPAARLINTTAPITGGGDLSADRTIAITAATTGAAGSMSAADKTKLDYWLTPVHMNADAAARGPGIADYFATTLSLEAASTYDIECHVSFLKTTAGTITWTWTCSNAPTMNTSRYEMTPVTGYTGATITGAQLFGEATSKAIAAMAHAATGSLTTAVDHSFVFVVRIRTNLATTIQLRSTESAGTITPRAGSYMWARKIV